MTVEFTVPGDPFGKQRPRIMKNGHVFTPEETKTHERVVAWQYKIQLGTFRFPEGSYIGMEIKALFRVPKSATKTRREQMLAGKIRPTVKPDWDNVGKLVCDALNGVAYGDDCQVVDARVSKFYAAEPKVEIRMWKIDTESESEENSIKTI